MYKSLAKDAAIYGFSDFFFKSLNFAVFPLVSFVLTVPEFGIYALLTTLSLLASLLFNCGMSHSLQRYYLDGLIEPGKKPQVISAAFSTVLVFAVVVLSFFIYLSYVFKDRLEEHNQIPWHLVALTLASCIPHQIFNYCLNVLRLNFKPWHFAGLNLLQNGLNLGLGLTFLFYNKWGVEGLIWGMALSYFLSAPPAFWFIRDQLRWSFDWKLTKGMILFGYPFIFTDVASWIFVSMDRWMLGEMSDNTEVGLYSIAFKLATVMIIMISAFGTSWGPHAMRAYNIDPTHKTLFSRCLSAWFYGLTIASMCLGLFGTEILMALTPAPYWPAGKLLPAVAAGFAFYGTIHITMVIISITKKTFYITAISWLGAVANFTLNWWWIPIWGAQGAAFASLISYALIGSSYLLVSQKLYPIPIESKKLSICFAILCAGLVFTYAFQAFPWGYHLTALKLAWLSGCLYAGYHLEIFDLSEWFRAASLLKDTGIGQDKQ